MTNTNFTTPLRPHKVLGRSGHGGDVYALTFTTGPFAGIIFNYNAVDFKKETDPESQIDLKVTFGYFVHDVPDDKKGYDKDAFEKELGDFLIELTYYGLERDHLGFTPEEG